MSDGFLCKNCGWQETEHKIGLPCEDQSKLVRKGYKTSLMECGGFQLNKKDSAIMKRLNLSRIPSDREMEMHERRATERYAWGAYAAHVRQTEFEKKIKQFNEDESSASSNQEREKVQEIREEFLKSCQTQNGWVIG